MPIEIHPISAGTTMSQITNLFADIPVTLQNELAQALLQTPQIRIERIVSLRLSAPQDYWYDQEQNEWVLLVAGAATLRFEDEVVEMKAGAFINIPAHRKHRIEWTNPNQPTIWLAVHYA